MYGITLLLPLCTLQPLSFNLFITPPTHILLTLSSYTSASLLILLVIFLSPLTPAKHLSLISLKTLLSFFPYIVIPVLFCFSFRLLVPTHCLFPLSLQSILSPISSNIHTHTLNSPLHHIPSHPSHIPQHPLSPPLPPTYTQVDSSLLPYLPRPAPSYTQCRPIPSPCHTLSSSPNLIPNHSISLSYSSLSHLQHNFFLFSFPFTFLLL